MARISGWELRQRAEDRGVPVSGKQFQIYREWGLLPEQPEGGWTEADVARLVRIRELGDEVRQMHRRVIRLYDPGWSIPPDKLRQAMVETIPSITASSRKLRAIYRAIRVSYGDATPEEAQRLMLPPEWRLPDRQTWQRLFEWPTAQEFALLAESVSSQAHALQTHPAVRSARVLNQVPEEEVVILLMTRQLMLGTRLRQFPATTDAPRGDDIDTE